MRRAVILSALALGACHPLSPLPVGTAGVCVDRITGERAEAVVTRFPNVQTKYWQFFDERGHEWTVDPANHSRWTCQP